MSKTLTEIAQQLKDANKKVQLIYAFNGCGKTRLSREFKQLIAPLNDFEEDDSGIGLSELSNKNILYYNAFTEDLFYWDNDLEGDEQRKFKIHRNAFTRWIFEEQGQDQNIASHFQRLTNSRLTPNFRANFSEIMFSMPSGDAETLENIKISKGEESNFIWSVFYSLLDQVIELLNVPELDDRETNVFDKLEYVFIDDPVSSLDENHLIELAVDVAELLKSSGFTDGQGLKFIITTHNPLFYNILCNEFNSDDNSVNWKGKHFQKYRLLKHEDVTFDLEPQPNDSPFSYHLFLKAELEKAANTGDIRKYHFNFLRNILEKTSTFVGFKRWEELLPSNDDGRANPYMKRIMNLSSHSKHSGEEVAEPEEEDKRVFRFLVQKLDEMYQLKMH